MVSVRNGYSKQSGDIHSPHPNCRNPTKSRRNGKRTLASYHGRILSVSKRRCDNDSRQETDNV